jgi:gliding motility-associated-like protein
LTLSVDTLSSLIKSRFKYIGTAQSRTFYLSFADADWAGAIDTSYQLGARLAVLNTLQKDTLVSNMLKRWAAGNIYPLRPTHGSAWIGLKQNKQSPSYSEPSGGWEWISGDPFTYQNWYPGEPNNNSIESEYGTTNWNNNTGKWDDASPQYKLNYLLEFPEQRPLQIRWSTNQTGDKITVSPTKTTKYFVTVTDGITSCQDSMTVTVQTIDTSLTLLDPPLLCTNTGTVRLQAGSASSYKWLKNGIVISGATSSQYIASQTGIYRVVVANALGCSDTSRSVSITLSPQPIPNFTAGTFSQCLTENSFSFSNTSAIPSGTMSYLWKFGDGSTSTSFSPSKTYLTAGVYTVKLIATSNNLCIDSISKQITVFAQPQIPLITGPDDFCTGDNIVLSTNGIPQLQWYRNDILQSGVTSSTYRISQSGDYKVLSTNSNGCASFSLVKKITENPLPQGKLDPVITTNICDGTPLILSASGASSYQWYYNNAPILGAVSSSYGALAAGKYNVEFFTAKGCKQQNINSVDLLLVKRPDANFAYDTYCVGVQTNFSSTSTISASGIVSYIWDFGDRVTLLGGQITSHTYTTQGSYIAKLIVTPAACIGLSDTAENLIVVQSPTIGISYPAVNAIQNKPQPLSARGIGLSYQWSPSNYLNNARSRTPIITTSKEQLYRILITNPAGCVTVDTQLVRVYNERNIYVPEGFTPDNDGRNDRLYPLLVGIAEMKLFRIYNRWGVLVFDNKNANINTGWDGNYLGRIQPMETYAWVAEGIDVDGNYIRRTGNTILVR